MSIHNQREFEKLRAIGRIVRLALDQTAGAVKPGITTRELDRIGARVLADHGAESAPPKVYGFPGALCISVNEEAIHGIPGDRVVRAGDLVKLDLVAEKDGYYADAAVTVAVGEVSATAAALARCAENAFRLAAKAARVGNRVYEIGRAVERETRRCGFQVMRDLCGHGVGRTIHEAPSVPNYHDPRFRTKLTEGLVITIEPIIAAGGGIGELQSDRWTIKTADRSWSAHYEHTVAITKGEPVLLTA
ncbi:MAG TPA: type I methionyl aminopeptidase [Candidatus Acidoferrales bacterium]|jgi:methionyl aminopeptidase|nr:type I methionyl aminopeptidase [Candidatus Acidoferrales bacterium]